VAAVKADHDKIAVAGNVGISYQYYQSFATQVIDLVMIIDITRKVRTDRIQ
jgi:hypothetical protein